VLLENEKMFHNDPEKMGVYMKLEELERRIKTESEARKKAEADKAKAEADKAKVEADKAKVEAELKEARAELERLRAEKAQA
jgi:septal ring factor EnvC (AmiA/AmiB activator)